MVSAVTTIEFNSGLRNLGNASMDFLNLKLVIETQRSLQKSIQEFIMTYNPHKMYLYSQSIGNYNIGLNINILI